MTFPVCDQGLTQKVPRQEIGKHFDREIKRWPLETSHHKPHRDELSLLTPCFLQLSIEILKAQAICNANLTACVISLRKASDTVSTNNSHCKRLLSKPCMSPVLKNVIQKLYTESSVKWQGISVSQIKFFFVSFESYLALLKRKPLAYYSSHFWMAKVSVSSNMEHDGLRMRKGASYLLVPAFHPEAKQQIQDQCKREYT